MNKQEYGELTKQKTPNSPTLKNCIKAFLIGGSICVIGQIVRNLWGLSKLDEQGIASMTCVTMISLGAFFTGLGVYDKIAKHGGAGTLVPITGFANAVTSPAMEFKSEGLVMGVGAKMFIIAGPVIVYGTLASVIYGIIYWLIK